MNAHAVHAYTEVERNASALSPSLPVPLPRSVLQWIVTADLELPMVALGHHSSKVATFMNAFQPGIESAAAATTTAAAATLRLGARHSYRFKQQPAILLAAKLGLEAVL